MAREDLEYEDDQDIGDTVEVIVEDDTPEEDRGREPMPEEIVQDLENDDLSRYSGDVKNRMMQMKKVWHDERRAKEEADRERRAALEATQRLLDENQRLKTTLTEGEREYIQTVQVASKLALDAAKRNLLEAHESGDSERLIEAQQTFNEATIKHERASNFKPALQQAENSVETQPIQNTKPKLDHKTQDWMKQNTWFGKHGHMTDAAMEYHNELERKFGAAYVGSDEYFSAIDNKVRREFPDYFGKQRSDTSSGTQTSRRTVPATVVAPATRSTTPKQIRLNASQVKVAEKFGMTPEQYAKEVLKLENRNG